MIVLFGNAVVTRKY